METIANAGHAQARDLPVSTEYALTVRDLLMLPCMRGAALLAGSGGVDKRITRVNVIEVPDILPWVKADELLLTTGFPLRHADSGGAPGPDALVGLIDGLAEQGATALGVKAGRYLDELPQPMLDAAERANLPLLLLPADLAFDDVLADVFDQLVGRQARALDVADRLHRALTGIVLAGGDLPQIAGECAALLDATVLVCTPDGRVQATGGETGALDGVELFDPSGRFRTERVHSGLQAAPDGAPGELAVTDIRAGETEHGLIVAYAPGGGLDAVAVQALERTATVAALAITKKLAVAAVESKFRGDFLRDALSGIAGPPEQVAEHCRQLGWDVARPLVVLVAQLDEVTAGEAPVTGSSPQQRLTAAWQQVVRALDPAAPVVGFSHEIVALVPADPQTVGVVVDGVLAAVKGDRGGGRRSFSTGVSRVIDDVTALPGAYEQARRAVLVGRRMHGPGAVAHFDSLGVHRLLSLVTDSAELRAFAAEVLGSLAADTPEAVDLRHTLQTLLDTNCNVAETARALHFHYNTLRYRIGKLEGIVGRFTSDPHLRLDVAMALRVVEMRGL